MKALKTEKAQTHGYESLEDRMERGRRLQSHAVFDALAWMFGKAKFPANDEHSIPHGKELRHQ